MSVSTANMFKGYSAKAKAKRALASYGESAVAAADKLLHMGDVDGEMKWGFNVTEVEELVNGTAAPMVGSDALITTAAPAGSDESEEEEEESTAPVASAGMFASIGATLGHVAAATPAAATSDTAATRAASRSSYVIEKDRPEQNGIKRPSAGGLCRAVWDAMDDHKDRSGNVPTTNDVRVMADKNNWNKNNAMIEYY